MQSEVAFEIDEINETTRAGWSVMVAGTAFEVADTVDDVSVALRDLEVDSWAGERTRWLRIEPRAITGRALSDPGFPAADGG